MAASRPKVIDQRIRGEMITLGQLIKLVDLIGSGGEIKDFLARTKIEVNGESENRRGRKLRDGDVVIVEGSRGFRVVAETPA